MFLYHVRWTGKCWIIYNFVRYEFDLQFEIPATYPATPIEMELPELDGKTHKMYRGGKICLDIHFAPLWAKHQPKLGIAPTTPPTTASPLILPIIKSTLALDTK